MATPTKRAGIGCWVLAILVVVALGAGLVGFGKVLGQATTRFPTIVGQNCGTVHLIHMTQSDDPNHAALCLWRAYTYTSSSASASCRVATLVLAVNGIDTGQTHVITIQSNAGRCALTDTTQGYSASIRGRTLPINTYACASLRQQFGGLLLSGCHGERNIYIPPPAGEQASTVCGTITNANHMVSAAGPAQPADASTVAGIEDCLWQAYVSCAYDASLNYEVDATSGGADPTNARSYTLFLEAYPFGGCGFSYVETVNHDSQSQTRIKCAKLARQADGGLATQGCDEGVRLVIPPATPPNL